MSSSADDKDLLRPGPEIGFVDSGCLYRAVALNGDVLVYPKRTVGDVYASLVRCMSYPLKMQRSDDGGRTWNRCDSITGELL